MKERLEEFAAEVVSFERWLLEGTDTGAECARSALVHLVNLYRAGLRLPAEWSSDLEDDHDVAPMSDEQWERGRRALSRLPFDAYSQIFNPTVVPADEPVVGSLCDDLGDVYRELGTGLRAYENDDSSGARWEWSFGFHSHWGAHATSAIRALHWWLVENASDRLASRE